MNEIVTERTNLFEPNVYVTVCVEITARKFERMDLK